ncbi:TPA: hypothetical protein ACMU26_000169 [Clostridioides difficile]
MFLSISSGKLNAGFPLYSPVITIEPAGILPVSSSLVLESSL